jgi:hypothetical protein
MSPFASGRRRTAALRALLLAAAGLAGAGCLGPDADSGAYLRFQNPEITAGLDSLRILGINTAKGDSVPVLRWHKGEGFPAQAPYPPGLEAAFTLLTQGYKGDALVYQSRTAVSGGHAGGPVHDFRLVAPALPHLPATLTARYAETALLRPAWEARPGVYRRPDSGAAEIFTPEGDFAWIRNGGILARDSVLTLDSLTFADSGSYFFTAENRAGRDSMLFVLQVRHMLPRIDAGKPTVGRIGDPLAVRPAIRHTDSLRFRWTREGDSAVVSRDSVLSIAKLQAKDTGSYLLAVSNASDSTEIATSRFKVVLASWVAKPSVTAGAQSNSGYGTCVDLDASKAMMYDEAAQKQDLLDLLFVYSGNALKIMSPMAAKRATDFDYAHGFDNAHLKDVRFVPAAKPPNPDSGRALFKAGAKVDVAAATQGQGFLVGTSDSNLVWIRISALHGTAGAASADFEVAFGGRL